MKLNENENEDQLQSAVNDVVQALEEAGQLCFCQDCRGNPDTEAVRLDFCEALLVVVKHIRYGPLVLAA